MILLCCESNESGKKRKRNESLHKANKRKKRKNARKSYATQKKGKRLA